MNAICVASLFLIVLAQAVRAYPYEYTRYCKKNTEICVNLRCSITAQKEQVPFSYHYSCCNGKITIFNMSVQYSSVVNGD